MTDDIKRYTSFTSAIDILRTGNLTLLSSKTWDDGNDQATMERYRETLGLGSLCALCATHTNETYHHWRVFAGQGDGVCLRINRPALEGKLRTFPNVRFGRVDYLSFTELEGANKANVSDLPFLKRAAYADEQEYRIVAQFDVDVKFFPIPIDLDWITAIVVNPWMNPPLFETAKTVFEGLLGNRTTPIRGSKLTGSNRWKRTTDKIARRKVAYDKGSVEAFGGEYVPRLSKEAIDEVNRVRKSK